MGTRIQPLDIEVPAEDPFRHDLLGRKKSVEVLTHLVNSIEGPCVLAVDATWGNGKTTFLRIWAQHLRNNDFPVVEFNAWETDFSDDPFVALSTELTIGLQEHDQLRDKIREIRKFSKEIILRTLPGLIRVVTAGVLDGNSQLGNALGKALGSYSASRIQEYQAAQISIKTFRSRLQEIAMELAQSKENRPLIVVIDELDRCRPSYAVELLEIAKHLFAVDKVIFAIAVNRSELAHSIKAIYGNDFDARGYLHRFFDLEFRLPEPSRREYIADLLAGRKVHEHFLQTQDELAFSSAANVEALPESLLDVSEISLRTIARAIHHFGLVLASLPSHKLSLALPSVVAVIFRTLNSDLYYRFIQGGVSDKEAIEELFAESNQNLAERWNERELFEAVIILGGQEATLGRSMPSDRFSSPLLQNYQDLINSENLDPESLDPIAKHALGVLNSVEYLKRDFYFRGIGIGFSQAVQRIELLSPDLIEELDERRSQGLQ